MSYSCCKRVITFSFDHGVMELPKTLTIGLYTDVGSYNSLQADRQSSKQTDR